MLDQRDSKYKPQDKASTKSQGSAKIGESNSTTNGQLKDSRSRYEKGMELYKSGKVSIGSNGLFKVSGYYEVDTERMSCNCPDYTTRKQECKHVWAACLFVKNRGKQVIEDLPGAGNTDVTATKPEAAPNKPQEANSKEFDRQATITRLAVINSAIELLKTHRTPLEPEVVISVAAQLERWALGQ